MRTCFRDVLARLFGVTLGLTTVCMAAVFAAAGEPTSKAPEPTPSTNVAQPAKADSPKTMKLWKEIDISEYVGSFVSPGDLNGDGKVDFLLSQMGPFTTPARLIALDHSGKKLWEVGDAANREHTVGRRSEPTCRGIALVYDIDHDGRAEVLSELWREGKPKFCLIEGATGKIRREIDSPLDMSIRKPEGYSLPRPSPNGLIAYFQGPNAPPAMVLKYEASNRIPCHAAALDCRLNPLWNLKLRRTGMGHIATVADLDEDGREEIVFGETAVDGNGKIFWQKNFKIHADCTTVADVAPSPGKEVLVSICERGPAYCLRARDGKILWEKTRKEVPHGQAIWAGDFIEDREGLEVIVLRSGHVGDFVTLAGSDGSEIARFQHATKYKAYPDCGAVVRWKSPAICSLWIPIDRRLVDGYGRTVADLGSNDSRVVQRLRCGTVKKQLATQAIPMDVCGDDREEVLLYQPYQGQAIFLFTQHDSDGKEKPYRPQSAAYNFHTYF